MNYKKIIALLAMASIVSTGSAATCLAEESAKDTLISQIIKTTDKEMSLEDSGSAIYTNIQMASRADSLPSQLDLRDRGVVPEIRDQGYFGTCWGFSSVAASEISILSDLGMTTQEFLEKAGQEMNLSERHLAWFSSLPIQEQEGMSEHDLAQVGEGRVLMEDDGSAMAHLDLGGTITYSSALFAAGIGPVPEELVPYQANDGSDAPISDWSVDESLHFMQAWELKDSSVLPSPAGRDENGNYVYNPIATEMIKQELLKGRGVSIIYKADMSKNPEAEYIQLKEQGLSLGVPEEAIDLYWDYVEGNLASLSEEDAEIIQVVSIATANNETYEEAQETYKLIMEQHLLDPVEETDADEDFDYDESIDFEDPEDLARAEAEKLGVDYDSFMEQYLSGSSNTYMNTNNYSQYVWDPNESRDHAVVIIGYDDNYPASNFLADHQPPADGAWIVRNSWGSDYGNDGYFYLSYYDMTIDAPETFEFVTDADSINASSLEIEEYDFMPADTITAGAVQSPVYMANEFILGDDSVLTYVSAMTANYDTNVTVAVYLLNEESQSPVDGELLDVRTVNYEYAGYHRIPLSQHYKLPKGAKISVVQTQRYQEENGMYYALPYTFGLNTNYCETFNEMCMMIPDRKTNDTIEGKIGVGESFVCVDDEWMDWTDFLGAVKAASPKAEQYIAFDNLSIKAYLYHMPDILAEHEFGDAISYAGGTMELCTDCGYSLVEK